MDTETDPLPYRAAEWIEHNWLELAFGINPVAMALASLATSDEVAGMLAGETHVGIVRGIAVACVLGLAALHFFLIYAYHQRKQRLSELRRELAELKKKRELRALEVMPLMFAYLKEIGDNDFLFGEARGESERLTVYIHNDAESVFIPIARYSNSPEYNEIARRKLPDHEGVLAGVWRNGWHCAYDYPSPIGDFEGYIARSSRDGIPKDTIRNLRMHPRFYCGAVVWNADRTRQVGALLLEATKDRYQRSFVEAHMKRQNHGCLGALIDAMD